jgi:hypothetical protein
MVTFYEGTANYSSPNINFELMLEVYFLKWMRISIRPCVQVTTSQNTFRVKHFSVATRTWLRQFGTAVPWCSNRWQNTPLEAEDPLTAIRGMVTYPSSSFNNLHAELRETLYQQANRLVGLLAWGDRSTACKLSLQHWHWDFVAYQRLLYLAADSLFFANHYQKRWIH